MIKQQYRQYLKIILAVLFAGFIIIQFIPSTFSRDSRPVSGEPKWDSPETREIFLKACADCHSNETKFPWYASVAPVSWLVESDVSDGKKHFNISEWDRSQKGGEKAVEEVQKGGMPIGLYLLMHPAANLNAQEKKVFVKGLIKTFGTNEDKEEKE
jgi:mono/diheme cytochrome c family protein